MAKRQICSHVTYVGVTGSCGKSTTTNLIGTILSSAGQCQTLGGDNRPASIAANLLSINSSTDYCIQEISAHQPGALRRRTRMLRPQIGVVTTIGGDHYKAYRSLAAVAEEKSKLVRNLPRGGVAILNADDPHVRAMAACTRARVFTYGHSPGTDFRAIEVSSRWPDRLSLTIVFGSRSLRIKTKLVGEHWTTSVLAAFACALTCGLDADCCVEAIAGFEPLFARSSVHSIPNGPDYILDTDKAPYWTFEHTFAILQKALAPRTTIVIGTISDYPGAASPRYRKVARAALQAADRVVFVGPHSGHVTKLSQGELAGRLLSFQTSYQVAKFLSATAIAGELIYIKSSVRDHLERILLTQVESVVCWKERCRKFYVRCPDCGVYRTPSSPPQ